MVIYIIIVIITLLISLIKLKYKILYMKTKLKNYQSLSMIKNKLLNNKILSYNLMKMKLIIIN